MRNDNKFGVVLFTGVIAISYANSLLGGVPGKWSLRRIGSSNGAKPDANAASETASATANTEDIRRNKPDEVSGGGGGGGGVKRKGKLILFGTDGYAENPWRETTVVDSASAMHSKDDEDVECSDGGDKECEIEVLNDLGEPVVLCWVSPTGYLKNYHPINDGSIRDGSVKNSHVEYTQTNHSFVCLRQAEKLPEKLVDVRDDVFLFLYTPEIPRQRHCINLFKRLDGVKNGAEGKEQREFYPSSSGVVECGNKNRFFSLLRIFRRQHNTTAASATERKQQQQQQQQEQQQPQQQYFKLCATLVCKKPEAMIVTAEKAYDTREMCGFTLKYEPGVFECVPDLEKALMEDLVQLTRLFPPSATETLQKENTMIWINKSLTYGPINKPIQGRGMCFHPMGGADWLKKWGMTLEKEGCIEIYQAQEFVSRRGSNNLWGLGGVMLHEFSHAYHNKCCPGGYNCEEIRDAYNTAMKRKLYDCIAVHGPQGKNGPIKGYCCANCMEFFAELSTAYMWTEDETTEYNKWFPFNRAQLQKHDPDSFAVLHKFWTRHD